MSPEDTQVIPGLWIVVQRKNILLKKHVALGGLVLRTAPPYSQQYEIATFIEMISRIMLNTTLLPTYQTVILDPHHRHEASSSPSCSCSLLSIMLHVL